MRRDSFIVTADDVPPVNVDIGEDTLCGWCPSVIGEEHGPECPKRKRSVVARMTIEFVTTIPEHWDEERFEFIHNGNRMCASNHIERLGEQDTCFCGHLEYVREADERDEQTMGHSFWWGE